MTRQIIRYIIKWGLTFLLILPCFVTLAQIDLKNSLPDLKSQYNLPNKTIATVKAALAISYFYTNNKGHSAASIDSSLIYARVAEKLSGTLKYKKGIDDARVEIANGLIIQNRFEDVRRMINNSTGTLYCRLQMLLGRYFLEKVGEEKADLDKAAAFFESVKQYTANHNMPNISLFNGFYIYNLMLERGVDSSLYNKQFNDVVARCKKYKNKRVEARIWFLRSTNSPTPKESIYNYNKTSLIASDAGDTALSLRCLKEIADLNLWMGNLDTSEMQLKVALKKYTAAGFKNTQYIYDLLAVVLSAKGNFETAMRYGLTAVSYSEANGTETGLANMQLRLAKVCKDLGQTKQSILWYQKSIETAIRVDSVFRYSIFRELAIELIAEGKAKSVLQQLDIAVKKYPPDYTGAFFIPMIRGDCYSALDKPEIAERYYQQVIDAFEKRDTRDAYYYWGYRNVGDFYIKQKNYKQAKAYVDTVLSANKGLVPIADLANVYQSKFKIDSANGNYVSAIKNFETAKAITDSILNQVKLKQTEQLQLQFETSKRDHENLVLRNNNNLQRSALEKEGLTKNLIGMVLIGSILVIGLMFYLYRAKQKSNNILKARQNEINKQNQQLNLLLNEKEWLMKEIHHRVKNNLQIISSLLNTQSSYLDNEEALTAIRDSQNRMQAISIVHQKLYQADDMATISLGIYIEELAYSIRDSFKAQQIVRFDFDIANIRLTTADTVPLGLILNEAITNSVKYAFTDWEQGVVTISMFETKEGQYQLNIRDNGKGLPVNFNISNCTSLGINLMIGLSEQLSGKFTIHSDNGTLITIVFHPSSE